MFKKFSTTLVMVPVLGRNLAGTAQSAVVPRVADSPFPFGVFVLDRAGRLTVQAVATSDQNPPIWP